LCSRRAAIGRAQRASARQQNGATSTLDPAASATAAPVEAGPSVSAPIKEPTVVDLDPSAMTVDDVSPISRSDSAQQIFHEDGSASISNRRRRKDKGKGKETESSVRVKEEPKLVTLVPPVDPQLVNLVSPRLPFTSILSN
jgi:hypothetical protein